jgi:hypothetical protein
MFLVNESTSEMECRVCGGKRVASRSAGGRYRRGSWQCKNKCTLPDRAGRPIRKTLKLPFDFELPQQGERREDYNTLPELDLSSLGDLTADLLRHRGRSS